MSKYNRKMAVLIMSACTMGLFTGASCDKLFKNMWVGFGESLGALPAGIIANNIVTPLLTSLGLTQTS